VHSGHILVHLDFDFDFQMERMPFIHAARTSITPRPTFQKVQAARWRNRLNRFLGIADHGRLMGA
jgi:hypothetical protein